MTFAGNALPNGVAGARVCVLVLGMHRSGTSALARTLSLLGCDLPKTLVPEAPGNEAGHWESAPVCKLNDALLDSAGTNWRDFEPVNPDWFRSPRAGEFRAKAIATLREEFGESFLYVLKDPRMCRIAGWWAETIEISGAAPAIISIVRHPLEVADSLKKRDNFDVALGELLWLRNTLDAEAQTRGRRRAFVSYNALLANWSEAIGRAQSILGLAWPKRQSFVTPAIDQFLSDKLRHHRRAKSGGADGAHAWAAQAFAILDRWAASGESADDYAALDAIRARLDEAGHAFARLVALQWYNQNQVSALEKTILDARKGNAELEKKIGEAEKRAQQAAAEGADAKARLAATESALRQRTAETDENAQAIERLKEDIGRSEKSLAAAKEETAALRSEIKSRFDEIAAMSRMLLEREAALADMNQRLADGESAKADMGRRIAARTGDGADQEGETAPPENAPQSDQRAAGPGPSAIARLHPGPEVSSLIAGRASDFVEYESKLAELGRGVSEREKSYAELDALFAARVAEAIELKRSLAVKESAERERLRQSAIRDAKTAEAIARAPYPAFLKKREVAKRAAILSACGLFDAEWYKSHYGDIAAAGVDPLRHFVEFGAREGRFPNGAAEAAHRGETGA
jgi:hypothetical protein